MDLRAESFEKVIEGAEESFRAREFVSAMQMYERAAELSGTPSAELCAKLARVSLEANCPDKACEWALRVVDSGGGFTSWSTAAKVIQRCGHAAIPRIKRKLRVGVVGTWTTNAFTSLLVLAAARVGIYIETYESPFDHYFNDTLDAGSPLFASKPEALILSPDCRSLGIPLLGEDYERILESELQRWTSVWSGARTVTPLTIIQHNFALPAIGRFGHYGSGLEPSRQHIAAELNRQMAIRAQREDVGIVNVEALASQAGKNVWFDERNWYMAKMSVSPAALPMLARHTAAVLAARIGFSRRCLVLDLDNTLWGGVIGDDGIGGLTLGDGPDGEAYLDFQRAIKELNSRGIILAVCSKNDPQIAREPFLSHPEMILKLDDIAAFVANWRTKSENILEIARTLNLGLDSLTFVDDNPYERAEVQKALPQVDIIPLPPEPTGFRRALDNYPYFEPSSFTAEDQNRSGQYQARAKAAELQTGAGSLQEYQASLGMVATLGPIDGANMARVVQLINKTNQFNLTTRRRERSELENFIQEPGVEHFWVRLQDRFADHGLIAVVIARVIGTALEIETFLMSCRVIGRNVEVIIRDELLRRARELACTELVGVYVPTPRNNIVADIYPNLGFGDREVRPDGTTRWTLDPAIPIESRASIRVERQGAATLRQSAELA